MRILRRGASAPAQDSNSDQDGIFLIAVRLQLKDGSCIEDGIGLAEGRFVDILTRVGYEKLNYARLDVFVEDEVWWFLLSVGEKYLHILAYSLVQGFDDFDGMESIAVQVDRQYLC